MLVDSKKLKQLRLDKNWTQQHVADVCDLSMRTIQRVEKDGVASNETVAAYAAIFELDVADLLVASEQFETTNRPERFSKSMQVLMAALFLGGFGAGIAITLYFV